MNNINEIYYPEIPTPKSSGINIFEIKDLISRYRSELKLFESHRLNFHAFLCITDGEVNHFLDGNKIVIKKGQYLLSTKGNINAFCELSDYCGYAIVFTEEFAEEYLSYDAKLLLETCSSSSKIATRVMDSDTLDMVIKLAMSELYSDNKFRLNHVGTIISIYILRIFEREVAVSPSREQDRKREKFNNFKVLVDENFARTRNIQEYAKMMNISYTYLNSVCQTVSGVTAKSFIQNVIIKEAKHLLSSTSLTYREIALKLGFSESSNFYKYFKKQTLQLPSDYRAKANNSKNR